MIEIEKIEANQSRGITCCIAYVLIIFGAGFQWGFWVAVFSLGVTLFIDVALDEALERCTKLKRVAK